MNTPPKRKLMLGIALAAVVAGVLIAVLSGGRHHASADARGAASRGHSEIQVAASYLGLSPRELRQRLRKGQSMGEIADASSGRSSAQLVATLLAAKGAELKREHLPSATEEAELRRLHHRLAVEVRRSRRRVFLVQAASYLGLDQSRLQEELSSGKTLAQIADATSGRSAKGLIDALVAARATALRRAVKDRQITPAEERAALATLHRRVSLEVERKLLQEASASS